MSSFSNSDEENVGMSPVRKRAKRTYISASEKNIILNIYKAELLKNPGKSVTDIVQITARTAGVSKRSVFRIRKEGMSGEISSPKRTKIRQKIVEKVDDFDKNVIRRIVHQFFHRNELPTIEKVLEVVNADPTLPNFQRTTFYKLLKSINFKFTRRGRNSFLNDREDIVVWRRSYLRQLKQFREANRQIYYLDETWINAGHAKNFVWKDTSIISARAAHSSGLSTGLKNPSGKGKRLIITHIGSVNGFVDGALWTFESKKTVNYHEEMNAAKFEDWFSKIIDKLEENSVVVMDNAPYHSRKIEKIPTSKWKKADIQQWLRERGIMFADDMVKIELLHIVKQQQITDVYAVNEIAKRKNVTILRLPPYHCELNPIEMIWAQVKNYVAARNSTFKFCDMVRLFTEAINVVTPENWKKCIDRVITDFEEKFWQLDGIIESAIEPFIINLNDSDDSLVSNTSCESNIE
ncbi:hypothetical protein ANTQUA_LOCUS10453 [Anthophora quadrimaculata]